MGALGRTIRNQQTTACSAISRVQLEAEHADGVETETDDAFGEARLSAQDKALGPFFGLVRTRVFTEVAVVVEVTRFEAGFAVADKVGMGDLAQGQAQGTGRDGQGQGGLSHYVFSSCVCGLHIDAGTVFSL